MRGKEVLNFQVESPTISPGHLRERLATHEELALLDVRENGVHARDGHLLLSGVLPLSRLELEVSDLVPRLGTPIVAYDAGNDDLAIRAARKLRELGYQDISVLAGGTQAWAEAGFELFTGSNVPGIAFGEFVEHTYGTPHLSARELHERLERGDNIAVIDSRPAPEFANFSIPGAINLPGAELVYRVQAAVPDPATLLVVNCAGRTRSIIGAQALINAGVPNPVAALANGTMDWLMAGFPLENGRAALPPAPVGQDLNKARQSGAALRERFDLHVLSLAELESFERDHAAGVRSLYLLDIRTEQEFMRGHAPNSRWAQGGQLVQQVERWVGTRNARIVLLDEPDLVRASITASWLKQINWGEVFIAEAGLKGMLDHGLALQRLAAQPPVMPLISAAALAQRLKADFAAPLILDVGASAAYRTAHIPGAFFAIRERLTRNTPELPGHGAIVVTSADSLLAAFAAHDLAHVVEREIYVLEGGTQAWVEAGFPIESGETAMLHPGEDFPVNAYSLPKPEWFAAFRDYLAWEHGLVKQLLNDGMSGYVMAPAS